MWMAGGFFLAGKVPHVKKKKVLATFDPSPVHVRVVVSVVALRKALFSDCTSLFLVSIIPPALHIHFSHPRRYIMLVIDSVVI